MNQIADTINISRKSVENILHNELDMTKVSAGLVPYILTSDQKRTILITRRENLALFVVYPSGFLESS